jgi:hypothetical protein
VTSLRRPILANSCARAATSGEARYRIEAAVPGAQVKVIALDEGAGEIVRQVAAQPWSGARFFVTGDPSPPNGDGRAAELPLVALDGTPSSLGEQLTGTDVVMMVTTGASAGAARHTAAGAAAAIGEACSLRGVMTAGVVIGGAPGTDAAVASLRTHARVVIVSQDARDTADVLSALRA